jgi:hypothetical protein
MAGEIELDESGLDSHPIFLNEGPNEDCDYFLVAPGPGIKITRLGIFIGSYEAVEVQTMDPKSKESATRLFYRPCFVEEVPQDELPS